jgi:hypothetical protein
MKPRNVRNVLWVLALVVCPCHLPVTLTLLAAWLGGATLTGFAGANLALIGGISTVLFVGFAALGWWLTFRNEGDNVGQPPHRSSLVARPTAVHHCCEIEARDDPSQRRAIPVKESL